MLLNLGLNNYGDGKYLLREPQLLLEWEQSKQQESQREMINKQYSKIVLCLPTV